MLEIYMLLDQTSKEINFKKKYLCFSGSVNWEQEEITISLASKRQLQTFQMSQQDGIIQLLSTVSNTKISNKN